MLLVRGNTNSSRMFDMCITDPYLTSKINAEETSESLAIGLAGKVR